MSDTALPRRVLIATMCFAFLVATAVVSVTFARANEVISTRQVLVLEGGEYQGGFRDRVDGLMVRVARG